MISVTFQKSNAGYTGLTMSGHAGYDDAGKDIVCAAVTSALIMTVNGVTEILKQKATAETGDNVVKFMLPLGASDTARDYLASLMLHLMYLSEDYPGTIKVTIVEV